ncbi:MAG: DUF3179 domain-containing protein [Gemmatimonadetes bacterium]|nr:DUF3179 domain-containing protein [Gemmatimonadota bacterium]
MIATWAAVTITLVGAATVQSVLPQHAASAPVEWRTDFSRHTVALAEIIPGGPPKDGIPAIDRPRFESVKAADRWLTDREPVLVVERGDLARAYPLQILLWHEIVNDQIGDLPVAVTYCPLCNTAIAFDRRHRNLVLDFGTTGRLRHSDLVMYDRQTESWWQQATGEAIVGEFAGDTLRWVGAQMVSWVEFRKSHPDGQVLSRETGFDRPYGTTPYTRYDAPGGSPLAGFFRSKPDARLPAMERVAAVRLGDESVAYPFTALREHRVVNDRAADRPVVVFWAPGMASAVDAARIASGRDVGSTGVFDRRLDGRTLTFEPGPGDSFRDRETGSTWSLRGRALAGPLRGAHLSPIAAGDYFWFAWAAFRPDTRIWSRKR